MVVVRNLLEYVRYAKCRVELAVALSRRPLPLGSGWEPWVGPIRGYQIYISLPAATANVLPPRDPRGRPRGRPRPRIAAGEELLFAPPLKSFCISVYSIVLSVL